ncbi:MAG: GNAT family N-acetyltransferase [Propionibacteriaceae bacterium]|nr:GNAT family N-acetyltransferase [Propionibacteriaceae bacterium]
MSCPPAPANPGAAAAATALAVAVEAATASDLGPIADLEAAAFPVGGWSADSWQAEIGQAGHVVYVGRGSDGRLVAVAAASAVGDTADLLRLIVRSDRRRQGLGVALAGAALTWAASQGAERVLLEVSAANTAALSLYRRLGFRQINRRAGYYGPGDDALVLARPLGLPAAPSAPAPSDLPLARVFSSGSRLSGLQHPATAGRGRVPAPLRRRHV